MSPSELLREIGYPFANTSVLLAMIVFILLVKLAVAAGFLGIWLAIVVLPAMFRFLLGVVDARVAGREVEPPGIEMFNWIAGAWTLMPFALLLGITWALMASAQRFGATVTLPLGIAFLAVYPASMGILALTRSPLGSINPLAIVTLIRIVGPDYLIIPGVIALLSIGFYLFGRAGLPPIVLDLANVYVFFLLFSLTGAVVGKSDVQTHVQNPDPVEPGEEIVGQLTEKNRIKVLDHAYGLVSRGNRDGGLAHIESYLSAPECGADDYRWFFERMLLWEQTEPALFFAQRYLNYLLNADEQRAALKLLSRCVLENPRFRPLPDDRERVFSLLEAHGREDLSRQLSGKA